MATTADTITNRYDSAWSESVVATTAPDVAPPPTPSAPQGARLTTTTARVRWDGLGRFGESMPADLDAVELHLSTSASYTPTDPAARAAPGYTLASDTYRGDIPTGLPLDVGGLTSGTTYYAVLVARDKAGNRSAGSPTTSL